MGAVILGLAIRASPFLVFHPRRSVEPGAHSTVIVFIVDLAKGSGQRCYTATYYLWS